MAQWEKTSLVATQELFEKQVKAELDESVKRSKTEQRRVQMYVDDKVGEGVA